MKTFVELVLVAVMLASPMLVRGQTQPAAVGSDPVADGPIVHVVLVWLKEPGNAEHRARIVEATRGFADIPGVDEIRVGTPIPSNRTTVDDSFDVGITMIFSSRQALDGYQAHPQHRAAQQTIMRALVRRVVVYDFEDDVARARAARR